MFRGSAFAALVRSSGVLTGVLTGVLAPPPAAASGEASDPFVDQVTSARALLAQQRYREALISWQAAYELRQHPELLLEIARTQQRLGMTQEAITTFRRFLTAHEHANPEARREAETEIARLSRLLPPPAVQFVTERGELPYRVTTRPHHRGMLAAGWTLFALGYAGAFGTGIAMGSLWPSSTGASSSSPSSAAGWTLLIPVVGPVISGIIAPATATSRYSTTYGLVWTLPLLLADLPFQVIGTALIIQGYRTPQKIVTPNFLTSLQVHPYASPSSGGINLSGSF